MNNNFSNMNYEKKYKDLLEKARQDSYFITPEESLGISSDEYNEIVDECIFGDDKEPKTTRHEGWVNIFKCGLCYSVWGNIYPTKEDALNEIEGDEGDVYITTIKIGWEEQL